MPARMFRATRISYISVSYVSSPRSSARYDLGQVPPQGLAVEQHHAELRLPAAVAALPRGEQVRAVEGKRPELLDVAEDLHVGVEIDRPAAIAGELRNEEPLE